MPIGIGSVGDIISICLLAKDLVEALNSSRGSGAENTLAVNDKKLHDRLTNSEHKTEQETNKQASLVIEVRDRLKENNGLISAMATKINESLRLQWFRQLGSELKTMMQRIFTTNVATYEAVVSIQRVLPSYLERTMFRDPFILEDVIGRISPVHMDFINSWDAFDAILRLRFEDVQGYKKVQDKEYVFQEHATKREIKRTRPWEGAFLPGQRIDMSLLFVEKADKTEDVSSFNSCPSCRTSSSQSQDSEVECAECGMWYRRITEFKDVDPPPVIKVSRSPPSLGKVQFGQNAFQGLAFGPKPHSKFPPISPKRKLECTDIIEDDISCFKRVRLVTSKERVKFIPGPFRQIQLSSQDLSLNATTMYMLEESKASEDFREKKGRLGSSHIDTLASLCSLVRTLHNVGKSSTAEELLVDILKAEEMTLVDHNPESLRILMGALMTALVNQNKLEAAEELWSRATSLFISKASEEEQYALVRVFELAHPFRIASPPQSVALEAIQDISNGKGGQEKPERPTSPSIKWQDSAQPYLSFFNWQKERESVTRSLFNFVPVAGFPQKPKSSAAAVVGKDVEHSPKSAAPSRPVYHNYRHPYLDMSSYIEPSPPDTLPYDKVPPLSFLLPSMKGIPNIDQGHLDVFEDEPLVCTKCPMKFENSLRLGRHVHIYHPLLYLSKTISQWTQLPLSLASVQMHCHLLAWVCHDSDEHLLEVRIAWKCCGKFSSTFAEFASLPACATDEHSITDIISVARQLKSTLVRNEAVARIVPSFSILSPDRCAFGEQPTCELNYSASYATWSCVIIESGDTKFIF